MNSTFTVPEENLICIYWEDSREKLIQNIQAAFPYMDKDMRQLANAVIRKLQAMTESSFAETQFTFTDE